MYFILIKNATAVINLGYYFNFMMKMLLCYNKFFLSFYKFVPIFFFQSQKISFYNITDDLHFMRRSFQEMTIVKLSVLIECFVNVLHGKKFLLFKNFSKT